MDGKQQNLRWEAETNEYWFIYLFIYLFALNVIKVAGSRPSGSRLLL